MQEIIQGHLYDYPKYYDLVFGSDWKAEYQFLQACFAQYSKRKITRIFEPACGTGRLMVKLAASGYEVAGNDLNPYAVQFCNDRLKRRGFPQSAVVGDMAAFKVKRKFDAAFNMINSFRHLQTEREAVAHLQCIANGLAKGGVYALGLHLTPTVGERINEESWSARRGNLAVLSTMWSEKLDLKKRAEHIGMTFDIYTLTKHFRIEDRMVYRTYTARQFDSLLKKVPELDLLETYDFMYEMSHPVTITPESEDIVFILRRK